MDFIIKNVQSIIIAMIFITIIEMIMPNNSNKKYIKIISSLYLLIIILNPILDFFNEDIDLSFFENIDSIQTSSDTIGIDLRNYYVSSLKETIKTELIDKGIMVEDVKIELDSDYTKINKIILSCKNLSNSNEIIDYLNINYGIDINNIIIN